MVTYTKKQVEQMIKEGVVSQEYASKNMGYKLPMPSKSDFVGPPVPNSNALNIDFSKVKPEIIKEVKISPEATTLGLNQEDSQKLEDFRNKENINQGSRIPSNIKNEIIKDARSKGIVTIPEDKPDTTGIFKSTAINPTQSGSNAYDMYSGVTPSYKLTMPSFDLDLGNLFKWKPLNIPTTALVVGGAILLTVMLNKR